MIRVRLPTQQAQQQQSSAKAGWIICTELLKQRKMNPKHYRHGLKVFQNYRKDEVCGYYIWAIPCVLHLRAHPDSLRSKALEVIFKARAAYLTESVSPGNGKHSVLGFIATHGLYLGCKLLAHTIAKGYIPQSPEEQELLKLKKGNRHV